MLFEVASNFCNDFLNFSENAINNFLAVIDFYQVVCVTSPQCSLVTGDLFENLENSNCDVLDQAGTQNLFEKMEHDERRDRCYLPMDCFADRKLIDVVSDDGFNIIREYLMFFAGAR